MSWLRFELGPFCAWVQHANHSSTEPPSVAKNHLKTIKLPYLCICLTCFDEIWHGDAYWPPTRDRPLKFGGRHLENHKDQVCWHLCRCYQPSPVFTARCYASAVLACVRLCRCSIETTEQMELVFGMWASFHPSYTVLKGNSVISKNNGTSLERCPILRTYKISPRHIDRRNVLSA